MRNDLRKMGVNNWKQTTQERKKWKEIIEQAKTHRVVELKKKKKKTPKVGRFILPFQENMLIPSSQCKKHGHLFTRLKTVASHSTKVR